MYSLRHCFPPAPAPSSIHPPPTPIAQHNPPLWCCQSGRRLPPDLRSMASGCPRFTCITGLGDPCVYFPSSAFGPAYNPCATFVKPHATPPLPYIPPPPPTQPPQPTIVVLPEWKEAAPGPKERGIRLFTVHVRRGPPDVQDPGWNSLSKLNCIAACIQVRDDLPCLPCSAQLQYSQSTKLACCTTLAVCRYALSTVCWHAYLTHRLHIVAVLGNLMVMTSDEGCAWCGCIVYCNEPALLCVCCCCCCCCCCCRCCCFTPGQQGWC